MLSALEVQTIRLVLSSQHFSSITINGTRFDRDTIANCPQEAPRDVVRTLSYLSLMGVSLAYLPYNSAGKLIEDMDCTADFGFSPELRERLFTLTNQHPKNDAREFFFLRDHIRAIRDLLALGELPVPVALELHPAFPCNVKCEWCIGQDESFDNRPKPVGLTAKRLRKIIEQSSQLGIREHIVAGYYSDPLLHSGVPAAIEHAANLGQQVLLVTSGIQLRELDKDGLRQLLSARAISISLDAGSDETYFELKGVKLGFTKALAGLRLLNANRHGRRPELHVGFLLHPANIHEIPLVIPILKESGANLVLFKYIVGSRRPNYSQAVREEAAAAVEEMRHFEDSSFRLVFKHDPRESPPRNYTTCLAQYFFPAVAPTGELRACCYKTGADQESLVDLKSTELANCWGSDAHKQMASRIDPSKDCPECPFIYHRLNLFLHFLVEVREKVGSDQFRQWCDASCTFYERLNALAVLE